MHHFIILKLRHLLINYMSYTQTSAREIYLVDNFPLRIIQ
jgi:hypothetical protein